MVNTTRIVAIAVTKSVEAAAAALLFRCDKLGGSEARCVASLTGYQRAPRFREFFNLPRDHERPREALSESSRHDSLADSLFNYLPAIPSTYERVHEHRATGQSAEQ